MPTAYPDGRDDFRVTSLPEDTPLSQAGPGATRNHPELHEDEGDAIEALQNYAAQRTHDHSNDPTDPRKGPRLAQVNTHQSPDTDASPTSLHHTLGLNPNQALPGNYVVDYNDATRIVNRPYVICTSATRPPMPYRGLQIYEADTDRVRVWASFSADQAITGLNSTDDYTSFSTSDWAITYDLASPANGAMGTPNGTHLSWTDGGALKNRAIARRIKVADKETQTDDQVLTWQNGPTQIEQVFWFTSPASNDKYFRMSADGSSYWRVVFGYDYVFVYYTTNGPANERELGRATVYANFANSQYRAELKNRTLSLYFMGELLMTVVDKDQVTNKGAAFRGWGTGMTSGDRFGGQTTPGNEDWVRIQDATYYVATNRWTILPVAKIPTVRLRQTANQQLAQTGSIVEWGEELEDEFDFFNVSNKTDIVIKEPGLYNIAAAIQWDPSVVPDTAIAVLCINGIETTVRKQQFMRGDFFSPGFSQTLDLTGSLRFATNDVLTVKVKYVASGGLLGFIFSWFDGPSKINSRLDLHYVRV